MKELFLLFLFSIKALTLSGQNTKRITVKYHGRILEKYDVLKSNKKIKHGEYSSFYPIYGAVKKNEVTLKEKGYFKFGKKDSLWIEYDPPLSAHSNVVSYAKIKSKGYYKEDKKVGVWLTYKGDVTERYDYDQNKKLKPYVMVSARYPKSAQDAGLQGVVIISFHTHKDCSVSDITVVQSLSPDCDNTAIDAIKKMGEFYKKNWTDCEEKTETQTINFKLE